MPKRKDGKDEFKCALIDLILAVFFRIFFFVFFLTTPFFSAMIRSGKLNFFIVNSPLKDNLK